MSTERVPASRNICEPEAQASAGIAIGRINFAPGALTSAHARCDSNRRAAALSRMQANATSLPPAWQHERGATQPYGRP